jgi:uncharacterized protein
MQRKVLSLMILSVLPAHAWAQNSGISAYPFYSQQAMLASSYRHFFAPRALRFAQSSQQLQASLSLLCAGQPPVETSATASAGASTGQPIEAARQSWTRAMLDWTSLSAITIGPLIQRRSVREIDFTPVREQNVLQAASSEVSTPPKNTGSGLKGFSALELLLWRTDIKPATVQCRYAEQLAQHIAAEARALQQGVDQLATQPPQDEAAQASFAELYNQWLGAAEKLRWQQMGKPLKEAQTTGRAAVYPRALSGQTRRAWEAHAQSVQALAERAGSIPSPQGESFISMDSYLRGQGQLKLADQLQNQMQQTSRALMGATPGQGASVARASQQVGQLKSLVQGPVADAVKVTIGFSDADGD